MFIGEYIYSIDDKKRVVLPPKFRQTLGEKVVITKGYEGCVTLYPLKEWEVEAKRISAMPREDANVRMLARKVLGEARDIDVDSMGRIIIPEELRKHAGLEKRIVMTGLYDRIEIWNEKKWNEYKSKTEDNEAHSGNGGGGH